MYGYYGPRCELHPVFIRAICPDCYGAAVRRMRARTPEESEADRVRILAERSESERISRESRPTVRFRRAIMCMLSWLARRST
jgi:hypothetical protein